MSCLCCLWDRKEVSLHNQSQVGQAVSSSPSYMPLFVRLKVDDIDINSTATNCFQTLKLN